MTNPICGICLRTDLKTRDIVEALLEFHDEITDYDVEENPFLKYCSICEHLLRKFYNFTQKCKKAQTVLKKFNKSRKPSYPNNLHELLTPTSLVISNTFSFQVKSDEYAEFGDTKIKQENELKDITQRLSNESVELIDTPIQKNDIEEVTQTFTYKCAEVSVTQIQPENDRHEATQNENVIGLNSKVMQPMLVLEPLVYDHDNNLYVAEFREVIYNSQPPSEIKGSDLLKETSKVPSCTSKVSLEPKAKVSKIRGKNLNDKKKGNKMKKTVDKLCKSDDEIEENNTCLSGNDSDEISLTSDSDDNSPVGKIIKELHEQMLLENKNKVNKGTRKKSKNKKIRPRKYQKELEEVFKIERFESKQHAISEMDKRKTSEWFLTAKHKCEICISVFRHSQMLDYHKRWHDPAAGDYECEVCQMRFSTAVKAHTQHMYQAHYAKFTCKECSLITYYTSSALAHCSRHKGVRRPCKICNKTFTLSAHKVHMLERHNSHICVTCGRHYASDKTLMTHRRRVHKTTSRTDSDATFECPDCGLKFAKKSVYTLHHNKAHRERTKIIFCKVCGEDFQDFGSIRKHRRENVACQVKFKPYAPKLSLGSTCSECGIEITSNVKMIQHMKTAHPDSEYVRDLDRRRSHMCDTCGKCFGTIYLLRDHMNIHKGIRPYQCELCPARFSSRQKLVSHKEWHQPPSRACEVCGKKFVSTAGLYNHMRTHIKDRRFKCPLCNKGFYYRGRMREHMQGVHYQQRRVRKRRQEPKTVSPTTTDSDSE